MANNRFDKKIYLLNKKMICLFSNVFFNKFLKKTEAINVFFL